MNDTRIGSSLIVAAGRAARVAVDRLRSVHHDQNGTISILSTFAMLMFTMLLLLVTNIAMQVDDKVKMQNAADSAAYSGAVVVARGMNAIAFTNHLECDILGVVAFLREARDQNAIQLVPLVLEQWRQTATRFENTRFEKFIPLPAAIPQKTEQELELALAWSEMAASAAEFSLPVFEHILGTPEHVDPYANDHLLPNFQLIVLRTIPTLAQEVTNEVSLRHGLPSAEILQAGPEVRRNPQSAANRRGPQYGLLWRTSVLPVGLANESDPLTRTLPVIDPHPNHSDFSQIVDGASYQSRARSRRDSMARHYLNRWLDDRNLRQGLGFFDREAQMSSLYGLYRVTTCAYLNELLTIEYPNTNLPMMLRNDFGGILTDNEIIERDYTYVGVSYRAHVNTLGPRMFRNPINHTADALTFAQVQLYLPQPMYHCCPWTTEPPWIDEDGNTHMTRLIHTNGWPREWSLFTQNWTVRLVPATIDTLPQILQTNPGGEFTAIRTPNLGGATMSEIDLINTH